MMPVVKPQSHIWFKTSILGQGSLAAMLEGMVNCVKIPGKKISNHGMSCTTITILRNGNTDNLNIAGLSCQRNLMSLDDYSFVSESEQREMSALISTQIHGTTIQRSHPKS